MSKAAGFIILLIALVSGLIASMTVVNYIQHQNTAEASEVNLKPVAITKMDIPSGTTLRREHFEVVNRPLESVPERALSDSGELIGRTTRATMYTGEIIMNDRLIEPGSPGGLPALIPPGMRAITLRVDETISVGGFVQPGHHVDIVTTIDVGGQSRETVSKVIIQNIKVLAVGKDIERTDEKTAAIVPTVTVLVSLDQAERIALASSVGQIRLILRNYKDGDYSETDGINLTSLIPSANREVYFPIEPEWEPELVVEEPTPIPSPETHTVIVYRGSSKTEIAF